MMKHDQERQMATDNLRTKAPERPPARDTGSLLLAAGGLTAAFGAASCCGLPVLLGSLGLGSAWLVAVAWIAAPHRLALFVAAVVCLVGAGGLFIWRRVAACTPGAAGGRPATSILAMGFLSVGAVLVVPGYMYA
jgi:mercuric ion transport protein